MKYYLSKYVGTYRVKADVDLSTNDYCRDIDGKLNNNIDIYIKCANGIKIFHFGGGVLEVYIPSIMKGRNIIRQFCFENNIGKITVENKTVINKKGKESIRVTYKNDDSFDILLQDISTDGTLFDLYSNDEEIGFKIRDKDLSKIISLLKPQTSGASISPFSSKNLVKKNYEYTDAQIDKYNSIINFIPKGDRLLIKNINNEFLDKILKKKLKMKPDAIRSDIKKEQLKLKDYIYYKGYEKEYINFLETKIKQL